MLSQALKTSLAKLSGDSAKDSQLIGQFGVGFYSAFIVADKVTVRTRAAGADASQGVEWISDGEGEFTIAEINKPTRGTEITLHLREDEKEFADAWRLRSIVSKYSDHISIPVQMWKDEVPESEGPDGEKIEGQPGEWEVVNKATALWTREKSEITDDEYNEFYKHISHDFADPLAWAHNKVEGKTEYIQVYCISLLKRHLICGIATKVMVLSFTFNAFSLWTTPNSSCLLIYVLLKVC